MRAPLPLLLAGMVATLALAGPLAGQPDSPGDAELNPARYRLAIADQPRELAKAPKVASVEVALNDAQKMSKEFRPAAALKRLDDALATAQGVQRGKIIAQKGYVQIAAKDHASAEASFARIARGEEPASEADYADARLRLGYLKIKRGDEAAALSEFLALGTGLVKATPEVAAEAGRRAAAILHKTGKYEEALDVSISSTTKGS